jgi:hypothetical protein
MRIAPSILFASAALLVCASDDAAAQGGLTITPTAGAFIFGSDLRDVRDQAETLRAEREGKFGLGLNVESGWLRGSLAYATGAKLSEKGVEGEIGDGSVLAVAADVVWRPLPRVLLQPYVLGGAGVKRQDYSYNAEGFTDIFPSEKTDFTLHFGGGADLDLGGVGIVAEVTDFYGRNSDDSFSQHDVFLMLGLKFRLGGGARN